MVKMTEEEFNSAWKEHSYSDTMSVSWCTGGTWGSCWGDMGSVSPDEPEELKSFDDFLIEYFPNISFMVYKKLERCIKTDSYTEGDYYGGSTSHISKECNKNDLKEVLIDVCLLEIVD